MSTNKITLKITLFSALLLVAQLGSVTSVQAAELTSVQSGNWSDITTWDSGTIPTEHDSVTITSGHTVTYDVISDEIIDLLTIDGTLDFSNNSDTRLTADEIAVYGTWQMGTAESPLPNSITTEVILTGQEEMLAVYDGTFLVHGETRNHTWTKLANTAPRDSRTLKLQQAVDWNVGDEIVVASTSYDASEAEVRTIAAISDNRKVLTLNGKLNYKHYGKHHEFAEVGLLSHSIVFSGDEEFDAGHIMFTGESTAQVLGATFDTLGTYATVAQYPLHFHLVGTATGSYIKQSAITNSSNRCITIHGTNDVRIEDNVAYNTKGHCYFLEDGVEQDNQFVHNLGVYTREGATIETDTEPATFWITNPQNTFRGNSAAGSEGFGYWYFLLDAVTGLSSDSAIVPRELRLQQFKNNTAHSNDEDGFTMDGHGFDSAYYMPTKTATFTGITSYKNADTGIWARGRDLVFKDALLLDNRFGASFAASNATLTHSTVIGESGNESTEGWMPYKFGFAYYDGPIHLKHVTFKDFKTEGDQTQAAVTIRPDNPYSMSPNSSYSHLHFKDATPFYMGDVTRAGEIFAVLNNAQTGKVMLPHLDFHYVTGCTLNSSWNVYLCPNQDYGRLLITYTDREPDDLTITRQDTNNAITMQAEGSSTGGRFVLNLPVGKTFTVDQGNSDGLKLYFYKTNGSVTVRIPYDAEPSSITDRGLVHTDWSYDDTANEVVLTVYPDREYIIYE